MLLFGGLCLLADSLVVRRTQGKTDWPSQDKVLAALAGLALGLTIGVRIDGLSDILPVVPFLGVLLAARRGRPSRSAPGWSSGWATAWPTAT